MVFVDSLDMWKKGLGVLSRDPYISRGRGKRSYLTRAQERARWDLDIRMQNLIEWALRARKAQSEVP